MVTDTIREVLDADGRPYVLIRVTTFIGNSVELDVDAGGPGMVDEADVRAIVRLAADKLAGKPTVVGA